MLRAPEMDPAKPRFDQDSAEVLVFTLKEGLLSAIAHDLKIRVTRFAVRIDEETRAIDATFDADSLRVVTAMKDGAENNRALGDSDKRKIEQHIADDVLRARKFPEIRFVSTSVEEDAGGSGYRVLGQLTLCGHTQAVSFVSRSDGEGQVAEIRIHQPDFGIQPFSAMLGTLKIKPDVRVCVSLPGAL